MKQVELQFPHMGVSCTQPESTMERLKNSAPKFLYSPAKLGWKVLHGWQTLSSGFLGEEKLCCTLPEKVSNALIENKLHSMHRLGERKGREIPYEKRKKYPQMSSAELTTLFCPSTICSLGQKKKKKKWSRSSIPFLHDFLMGSQYLIHRELL